MEARQEFYETLKKLVLDRRIAHHVGLWNQDTDFLEESATFALPAVFVEFGPMEWQIYTNDCMKCTAEVKLHLVTAWDTEDDDAAAWTRSLSILQLMAQMAERSMGDNFAVMHPIATVSNSNHGNIMESIDSYAVNFYAEFRP